MIRGVPRNILIADNDLTRIRRLTALLKRFDYNIFVATEQNDFTRIINGIMPNLVLLNINMRYPGGSGEKGGGESFFNILRGEGDGKAVAQHKMIKVVTISSPEDEELLKESLKEGADGYLVTPLGARELYKELQGLMEMKPRSSPRVNVVFSAFLTTGRKAVKTFATMISETGTFLRSATTVPLHSRVTLVLDIPVPAPLSEEPLTPITPITIEGRVQYIYDKEDEDGVGGMGIGFLDIEDGTARRLRSFIESY